MLVLVIQPTFQCFGSGLLLNISKVQVLVLQPTIQCSGSNPPTYLSEPWFSLSYQPFRVFGPSRIAVQVRQVKVGTQTFLITQILGLIPQS
jgi:hypothetical protein